MSETRRSYRLIKIEIAGLLFVFPVAAWAQLEVFRPAQFGADNALTRMEVSPDDFKGEAESSALRCQGFVETDGELTDYYCVSDDILADERVIGIVRDTLQDQEFVPAQVGGVDVRVLMNFAVLIACGDEGCSTLPVPNHAYLFEDLGPDYIAPQPILDARDWYEGFDSKLGWRRLPNDRVKSQTAISVGIERGIPYPMALVMAVDVDEQGNGVDACVYWIANVYVSDTPHSFRRLIERRLRALEEARFIPGFEGGRPATMRLFESVIDYDVVSQRRSPTPMQDLMCSQ